MKGMLYTSQTTEEGTKASHEPVKYTNRIVIVDNNLSLQYCLPSL